MFVCLHFKELPLSSQPPTRRGHTNHQHACQQLGEVLLPIETHSWTAIQCILYLTYEDTYYSTYYCHYDQWNCFDVYLSYYLYSKIDFRRFNEVIGTKYNSKLTILYYLTKYTIIRGPWCGVILRLWTWDWRWPSAVASSKVSRSYHTLQPQIVTIGSSGDIYV